MGEPYGYTAISGGAQPYVGRASLAPTVHREKSDSILSSSRSLFPVPCSPFPAGR